MLRPARRHLGHHHVLPRLLLMCDADSGCGHSLRSWHWRRTYQQPARGLRRDAASYQGPAASTPPTVVVVLHPYGAVALSCPTPKTQCLQCAHRAKG
jgi:hypothetical protein